ncbi:GIY-YIG nuclease family protein [Streptomyces sp. CAI-121]|uniref:GIY-YIG nuclease family protein n=1 Tax=unclassified Streptomyces TaxID=2593676 RepID=UPI0015873B2E|nr:GIY-YIG nuclease family protein [Streptomyces sp. CAI-121]NUW12410.1 GIY-YIG nuclease family protein [Streptomyces sp. CAI-68]
MQPQGRTALYRLYDATDRLLYVGISNNPRLRWASHAADKAWWVDVVVREVEWFPERAQAEAEEARLIGSLTPLWNSAPGLPSRSAPRVQRVRPGWEPPTAMSELVTRYEAQQQALATIRNDLEACIAAEMMKGVSAHRMAKFLPWEAQMISKIGRNAGVPPLRPATVISVRRAADRG